MPQLATGFPSLLAYFYRLSDPWLLCAWLWDVICSFPSPENRHLFDGMAGRSCGRTRGLRGRRFGLWAWPAVAFDGVGMCWSYGWISGEVLCRYGTATSHCWCCGRSSLERVFEGHRCQNVLVWGGDF